MLVATVTRSSRPACVTISASRVVLLRVQHLVGDAALGEQTAEDARSGHAGGADEDRLALGMARLDVVDDGVELRLFGLVDQVGLVDALERSVRRDRHDTEPVGVHQLGGLGLGRTGHAGEFVVHAEVVLEGDRGEGLVLLFDLHPFLRLDRLVDALGPTATLEDATGELVDDLHLAALDDVVLVALVQLLGLERHRELVDEVRLDVVVQVVDLECGFDTLDAGLERDDDPLVLFDLVVDVTLEATHDRCEPVVQLRGVGDPSGDDQRCAGLVDEDRVDFVDDAVVVTTLLHLVGLRLRHVVAQVVEAHLVVGAVRDVGTRSSCACRPVCSGTPG